MRGDWLAEKANRLVCKVSRSETLVRWTHHRSAMRIKQVHVHSAARISCVTRLSHNQICNTFRKYNFHLLHLYNSGRMQASIVRDLPCDTKSFRTTENRSKSADAAGQGKLKLDCSFSNCYNKFYKSAQVIFKQRKVCWLIKNFVHARALPTELTRTKLFRQLQ